MGDPSTQTEGKIIKPFRESVVYAQPSASSNGRARGGVAEWSNIDNIPLPGSTRAALRPSLLPPCLGSELRRCLGLLLGRQAPGAGGTQPSAHGTDTSF